jgi:membrane glycosyltransferase
VRLFSATALLLFLPKLLSALLIATQRPAGYGGAAKLWISVVAEMALSALFAPIRMLFHTQFVLSALIGRTVRWRSPPRDDAQTTWLDAIRRHGVHTLLGIAWAGFVWWLNPTFLWWLLPVAGALILSIPLSVYTSRVSPGRRLRRRRLFLIPEEARPPAAIRATRKYVKRALPAADAEMAVVDPLLNALVCAQGVARHELPAAVQRERDAQMQRALREGWSALGPAQQASLLGDPLALSRLHAAVWTDDAAIAESWRRARDSARAPPPRPWQPAPASIEAARPAA